VRSQILSRHLRVVDEERVDYPAGAVRPTTRGDCLEGGSNAVRPCPWVSCRHHLFVDVTKSGSVSLPWRDQGVGELEETCSLDVAERGGMTLEDVGKLMNVTRERTRQLEESTLRRLATNPMTKFLVGMSRQRADWEVTTLRRRCVEEGAAEVESGPELASSIEPETALDLEAAAFLAVHG
jgi:Sigma-70, region 4